MREAFGLREPPPLPESPSAAKAHLVKRLVYAASQDHVAASRARAAEAGRVRHEQEVALALADGRWVLLRCARCWRETAVARSVRDELARRNQFGAARFECRECLAERADREHRTSRERAALAETVAEIMKKGNRR